jgi:CheY-like chemotaxis protein
MPMHVLVIDDDADLNRLLGDYLREENFAYHQALSGKEGLTLARNLHPEAIVLDVMLPDIDGYEVCRSLKACRSTCDIPVILLTCMCQPEHIHRSRLCGAWDCIAKPYAPDKLIERAREAVAWRSALAERPASSHFRIDAADFAASCRGVYEMLGSLACRTAADDVAIGRIRDAFLLLVEAVATNRDPLFAPPAPSRPPQHLDIQYTIEPASPLAALHPSGGRVSLRISEESPGIIYAALSPPSRRRDARDRTALQAEWKHFLEVGGFTLGEWDSNLYYVNLTRCFTAGGFIQPADGNVLPINTPIKENSGQTRG